MDLKIAKELLAQIKEVEEKVFKDGFIVGKSGLRLHKIKTDHGEITYTFDSIKLKDTLKGISVMYLAGINGLPIGIDDLRKHIDIPPDAEEVGRWIDVKEGGETDVEADKMTERAMEYFIENLNEMFIEAIHKYIEESFFQSVLKNSGKGYYILHKTESEAFKHFASFYNESIKQRLGVRKGSGRKSNWSEEDLQEMLSLYDTALILITESKKNFALVIGNYGWEKSIKAAYPQLPDNIIEMFNQQGVTPGEMALTLVAERFDAKSTEYLRQLIMETRKSNKESK